MYTVEQIITAEGKKFIKEIAQSMNYSHNKIEKILCEDSQNLFDVESELCIRMCESDNCKTLFDEGYLTEDSMVFCSEQCCYNSISDLTDEDFGEYVYFTNWHEEREISA